MNKFDDMALGQIEASLKTNNGVKLEAILLRLIREGLAIKSDLVPDLQKILQAVKLKQEFGG